jgi:hypothetical protein
VRVTHPAGVTVIIMMHCIVCRDAPTGPQKFVHLPVLAAVPITVQDKSDLGVSDKQSKRRLMPKEGTERTGSPDKFGNRNEGVTLLWSLRKHKCWRKNFSDCKADFHAPRMPPLPTLMSGFLKRSQNYKYRTGRTLPVITRTGIGPTTHLQQGEFCRVGSKKRSQHDMLRTGKTVSHRTTAKFRDCTQ